MTLLSSALHYAASGLRVLPIRERAKEPLCGHGVHDASCDPQVIRESWAHWPRANIGIAVPRDFFVLDLDLRNGGDRALERLQLEHGDLPATITARTGSGGSHMLFARPGIRLRGKIASGLDVLGVGRYFLAAPSIHPCGGRYKWTSPRGTAIAQPPAWLVRLATADDCPADCPAQSVPLRTTSGPSVVERARRYLASVPPAISGSGGHAHTFVTAQRLVRGFKLDQATAFALLTVWNRTCLPPWSARELARKVQEALRFGRLPIGSLAEASRDGRRGWKAEVKT